MWVQRVRQGLHRRVRRALSLRRRDQPDRLVAPQPDRQERQDRLDSLEQQGSMERGRPDQRVRREQQVRLDSPDRQALQESLPEPRDQRARRDLLEIPVQRVRLEIPVQTVRLDPQDQPRRPARLA